MRHVALALLLSTTLQAQKPTAFSKPWNFSDTGGWSAGDSIRAGAVIALFSNLYCDQVGAKWYWRIIIPFVVSELYEVSRWADGQQPLALNGVWAAAGAAGVTFVYKVRF